MTQRAHRRPTARIVQRYAGRQDDAADAGRPGRRRWSRSARRATSRAMPLARTEIEEQAHGRAEQGRRRGLPEGTARQGDHRVPLMREHEYRWPRALPLALTMGEPGGHRSRRDARGLAPTAPSFACRRSTASPIRRCSLRGRARLLGLDCPIETVAPGEAVARLRPRPCPSSRSTLRSMRSPAVADAAQRRRR